jgi:hypothetical protein
MGWFSEIYAVLTFGETAAFGNPNVRFEPKAAIPLQDHFVKNCILRETAYRSLEGQLSTTGAHH